MLVALFTALFCGPAFARDAGSGIGAGLILSGPTGFSGKYWMGGKNAVDGAMTWSSGSNNGLNGGGYLYLHADYLIHKFGLIKVKKGRLPVYYGLGAKLWLVNNAGAGARVPFGLSYIFAGYPLDIFLELVPGLNIVPNVDFDMDGAFGVRYYFK